MSDFRFVEQAYYFLCPPAPDSLSLFLYSTCMTNRRINTVQSKLKMGLIAPSFKVEVEHLLVIFSRDLHHPFCHFPDF